MYKIPVGGILQLRDLTMMEVLGLPNRPGYAGKILTLLGDAEINLHFIAECEDSRGLANIAICIDPEREQEAANIVHLYEKTDDSVTIIRRPHVSVITVYGPHFREKPAICGNMCAALGEKDINILGISTSISSVCSVVADQDFEQAYEGLLTVFSLP